MDTRHPIESPDRDRAESRAPGRPRTGLGQPRPMVSVAGEAAAKPAKRSREVGNVELQGLNAYYGSNHAVRGVSLAFDSARVTAIIGPSGCGKSTMVRCINRMHEEIAGRRSEGQVLLDGLDLYDPRIDVVAVRRSVGMVFQKPNPFPTMSIYRQRHRGPAPDRRLARRARGPGPRSPASGRASGTRSRTGSRGPASDSPAASSSASASPGRSRSTPRCC